MKTIAVSNQKGGVSKTTTSIHLAIGLARQEYKVLIIDTDAQSSLSIALGCEITNDNEVTISTHLEDLINNKEISALDWLTKVCKVDFLFAMNILTGVDISPIEKAYVKAKQFDEDVKKEKILLLPDKANGNLKAFNYLTKTRCIASNIVQRMIDNETIYQDDKTNVVFVGYDENHVPKFACVRGTSYNNFRLDCKGSDKRYSFNIKADSKNLYVFESPIDLLSHATIENIKRKDNNAYLKNNRLSLGGTSPKALEYFLKTNKIENICLCLDNDEVGIESSNKIILELEKDFNIQSVPPKAKDYNEDLIRKIKGTK